MIEVNDNWYYVGLWFVPGDLQDYFAIAFRRAGARELEAFYRFRRRGDPDPFAAAALATWGLVHIPSGAGEDYVIKMFDTVTSILAKDPAWGRGVDKHLVQGDGRAFAALLAVAPWGDVTGDTQP